MLSQYLTLGPLNLTTIVDYNLLLRLKLPTVTLDNYGCQNSKPANFPAAQNGVSITDMEAEDSGGESSIIQKVKLANHDSYLCAERNLPRVQLNNIMTCTSLSN